MFKKIILKGAALGLATLIGSSYWIMQGVQADTGSGHTNWYSSVDSGEIRWGGTTKHTSARDHGISTWNAQNSIDILKDTATTIQDLTFRDVYSVEDFTGRYTYLAGADEIKFNDRYFESRSSSYNKKTATHEIGHALGLDDHYSGYSGIIMYGNSSSVTSLQAHDKEDYGDRW
jgi:hypothetical protein